MNNRCCTEEVIKCAEKYKDDMSSFLRDIIAIPCESCSEELKDTKNKKRDGKSRV